MSADEIAAIREHFALLAERKHATYGRWITSIDGCERWQEFPFADLIRADNEYSVNLDWE